jgi:hypothetical protein
MIDIIYSGNGNVTQSEGWNFGLISSRGWLKLLVCDGDKENEGLMVLIMVAVVWIYSEFLVRVTWLL